MIIGVAAGACAAMLPGATESAIANGDTRTLHLYHAHTHESISATFLVDGQYDQSVLDKLNWFLRDWRRDEPTKMDPRLFDTVWEVYRESGSQQPIEVMSAYRSPETNAMLRRRSRQVAEHSQHILGKAMDQHYMDVPMSRIRELGMKLQRGGVGFYPTAGTPFVHLDVGGVRHWPRMNYDQLARLFPDGKTVHIPSNGQPLPGYEEARAELEARGDGSYPTASQLKSKGFFAWLFGGGGGDEDEDNAQAGSRAPRGDRAQRYASLEAGSAASADVGRYGKNTRDAAPSPFFAPPRVLFGGAAPQRPAIALARQPAPVAPAPVVSPPEPPVLPPPPAPPSQAQLASAEVIHLPETPGQFDGHPEATGADAALPSLPVSNLPFAPIPPRRPVELAALGPAAPLPPSRPSDLPGGQLAGGSPHDASRAPAPGPIKPDSIVALLGSGGSRIARLPDMITQGTAASKASSYKALGYAASPSMTDVATGAIPFPVARPTALLSAHLDRSNFRSMTRPEATDRVMGRTALGAALPPLRAAARGDLGALTTGRTAHTTTFQSRATDMTTDRFSGSVAKAGPQARSGPARTDVD